MPHEPTLLELALQLADDANPAHVVERAQLLREAAAARQQPATRDRAYAAMQQLLRLTLKGDDDAA